MQTMPFIRTENHSQNIKKLIEMVCKKVMENEKSFNAISIANNGYHFKYGISTNH